MRVPRFLGLQTEFLGQISVWQDQVIQTVELRDILHLQTRDLPVHDEEFGHHLHTQQMIQHVLEIEQLGITSNGHDPVETWYGFKHVGNEITDGICPETVSPYRTFGNPHPYHRCLRTKRKTAGRTPDSTRARTKCRRTLCSASFKNHKK